MKGRFLARAAVAGTIVVGAVVGFASPAFAHAQLLGTSPSNGAIVATAPADAVLTFGETVQAPPTAIEIYNANGQRLVTGPVGHPAGRGDQVEVALPAGLKGTYVVSWRVISADTHPVQGAFTFSVGAPATSTSVGALEQHLLSARHPSRAVGLLTGALRTVILLAVIVAVGAAGLLAGWPEGLRRRRVRLALVSATGAAAVGSAAAVLVQGPYDAGKPLTDALQTAVLSPVLHSSFGTGAAVRIAASLVLLAGTAAGVAAKGRQARRDETGLVVGPPPASEPPWSAPLWLLAVLAGCGGLVVSLSLSGHATTGRWEPFGLVADLVHVAAGSVWVGGLMVLAWVLCARGAGDDGELGVQVRRFSATAAVSVVLIVVSGVFQAWRQVGSWNQLSSTDYGTILLLKVTLVAAAVEAGWFSRRWVTTRLAPVAPLGAVLASAHAGARAGPSAAVGAARRDGPGAGAASGRLAEGALPRGPDKPGATGPTTPAAPRFRRWLAFEAVIGLGVVALTGALVDAAPPQAETVAASARAYTHATTVGSDSLSVAVYPLVPGTAHVAVQLTNRATDPVNALQVTAQLTLPSRRIGPITVALVHPFVGSWVADNVVVPLAGRWQLQVTVLTDPITEVIRTFTFTVYG
ncbi:MAG TPA: copper resistance protein CopC [Acidimicrobiales bacterium]